eukprot:CAMPEP_0113518114 /NCGR_PEP_ID=MMETSP0014_2-20120614/42680_1 /TAXON_ID=2857 /ORGANISM="Nitzschia sp." /LENGTH=269 /DNA_ID=CAMNT_0000415477 /DNA_START=15 /DNA_END=824 /DNA_ORIENTATION=- /assembly_acc=CAM_ASM_000159
MSLPPPDKSFPTPSLTGGGGSTNTPSSSLTPGAALNAPHSIYQMIMSRQQSDNLTSDEHYTPQAALHRTVMTSDESGSKKSTQRHMANSSNNNKNDDDLSLDRLTRKSLPFFMYWQPSAGPTEPPLSYDWLTNSCGGKAAIGVFGGGVMGLLMGVFLGAMSDATPPVTVIAGKEVPQAPLKEQMRVTMRATAEKSIYWCKNFAFITGVFGGSECLVEKFRGKHDMWNSVASGCITGAALQAKSGPQAAAIGCGGFAAFSIVIDSVMGTH